MSGDGLRDEIAEAIAHYMNVTMFEPGTVAWGQLERGRPVAPAEAKTYLSYADAVLPVVQARIDAAVARAEAAERAVRRVRAWSSRWFLGLGGARAELMSILDEPGDIAMRKQDRALDGTP